MSYLKFEKKSLVNLEYALTKELLRTNRAGSYASTTIVGCNTRKYHGLLVCPQPPIDDELHVLLSSLDVTVIQFEKEFNLGIHKYPGGIYSPKGHKYIDDFTAEPIPKTTYSVGNAILTMERIFSRDADRIIIKYTLEKSPKPLILRFKPFLAFRNRHKLSKANNYANKKFEPIPNGIRVKLYQGYSYLNMQFSENVEYIHVPDWYYNIEYDRERVRGYDYQEDLYSPGFFELSLKQGDTVFFSGATDEIDPPKIKKIFFEEIKSRIPRNNFRNCLLNAAQQFIVKKGKKVEIIAGFPWFGRWGRDTFISLPGLTLESGNTDLFKEILDTMTQELKGSFFPNIGAGNNTAYNSVDAPLWFFWALQKYCDKIKDMQKLWQSYGKYMKAILQGYKNGVSFNIKMLENSLIWAGEPGKALTWMDAIADGKPVTPRIGMPVEINALWYNAIMFTLDLAKANNDEEFVQEWKPISKKIPNSFLETFWSDKYGYLADYVSDKNIDWSIRPNQIFAASLPYSPISEPRRKDIVDKIDKELLTTRGLRTLSPNSPEYEGAYYGDQITRDKQYHQGTVWPWLFGHFVEAYLKIYKKSGLSRMEWYYERFEETMLEHGIGTISEVYDGDPPHKPGGSISQAWSVAELLRVGSIIESYKNNSINDDSPDRCSKTVKAICL